MYRWDTFGFWHKIRLMSRLSHAVIELCILAIGQWANAADFTPINTNNFSSMTNRSCRPVDSFSASSVQEYLTTCTIQCGAGSDACNSGVGSYCLYKNCQANGCSAEAACKKDDEQQPDSSPTAKTGVPVVASRTKTAPTSTSTQPKTTPQSSTGDPQQDLDACQAALSEASRCCNNPTSCMSGQAQQQQSQLQALAASGNTQGVKDYCKQMQSTGGLSTAQNESAGSMCYRKYMACKSTCEGLSNGSSASGELQSMIQQCNSFASRVSALGAQGGLGSGADGSSQICQQAANAQPQSLGGGGMPNMPNQNNNNQNNAGTNDPNDPTGCNNNPTGQQCQKCTANPNDPSCGTPMTKGQSAFSESDDKPRDKSGFDLPSVSPPTGSLFDQASTPSQPAKNGTIANNTGGAVGGQNGGGGPANLGGGGGKKVAGGSGVSTDILQGNMPGGYTSNPGGSTDTEGGGGWGGYGGRMPASNDGKGMDLKQFLPGQKNAPAFVGGAYSMRSAEIAGKHGDIFEKITRKFHEKCLMGQLIGCDH